jgi:hypothetical protein
VKLNNSAINSSNFKDQLHRNNKDEMKFIKRNDAYNMTKILAAQKHQQRMPLSDHQLQQQQQQQHNPLARTVSTPMPIPDANQVVNVNNLFSSLNDILNGTTTVAAANAHRKLERTQSEPIPQTNFSR